MKDLLVKKEIDGLNGRLRNEINELFLTTNSHSNIPFNEIKEYANRSVLSNSKLLIDDIIQHLNETAIEKIQDLSNEQINGFYDLRIEDKILQHIDLKSEVPQLQFAYKGNSQLKSSGIASIVFLVSTSIISSTNLGASLKAVGFISLLPISYGVYDKSRNWLHNREIEKFKEHFNSFLEEVDYSMQSIATNVISEYNEKFKSFYNKA